MFQILGEELFNDLLLKAQASPRKRSHFLLHASVNDPVQQICIGFCGDSYVQPHQHPEANKWEHLVVLRGSLILLLFDDYGTIKERIALSQGGGNSAITFPHKTWHTVIPNSPSAIVLETKEGPYVHSTHSEFATWAPTEGGEGTEEFMRWGLTATVGDQYR